MSKTATAKKAAEKRGPGRPADDGAINVKNKSIALTDTQRTWVENNGGSRYVRGLVADDMARADKRKQKAAS